MWPASALALHRFTDLTPGSSTVYGASLGNLLKPHPNGLKVDDVLLEY